MSGTEATGPTGHMLRCDWCREPIEPGEAEATLVLVCKCRRPEVGSGLRFHENCGIMALYGAAEEIEDHVGADRPDPATEELLEHIPTLSGPNAPLDGPVTDRLKLVQHLGEKKVTYALYRAGIKTLLDATFRTRAEVAAIPCVGPASLRRLEAAMRERGLMFQGHSEHQEVQRIRGAVTEFLAEPIEGPA